MHSEICKTHKFAFAWAVPLNFNFFFLNWYRRKCKIQTRLLGKCFISFLPLPPGIWPFFYNCKSEGIGNLASICFNGTFYVQIVFIIDRKFSVKQLDPVRNGSTALHFESVWFKMRIYMLQDIWWSLGNNKKKSQISLVMLRFCKFNSSW